MYERIEGGVTAPAGFFAGTAHAGIKKGEGPDVTVLTSEVPAQVAALFTTNQVQAAPVRWCRNRLASSSLARAVVVNSGNANACTGEQGWRDVVSTAQAAADALRVEESSIWIASTGVIGVPLPLDKLIPAVRMACTQLQRGPRADEHAARAIMTTDTYPKLCAVRVRLSTGWVTIGGMAKGAGMIHPNMATMLAFVTTDANIPSALLQSMLREAADESYHMISVDGDSSTNDTVMVLANGAAGTSPLMAGTEDYARFIEAFRHVHRTLAQSIAWDGEGRTKRLEVTIRGARTVDDARRMARTVISSNLVKTALFGEDANWGRVLAAMGRSGAVFDPDRVSLMFTSDHGSVRVLDAGGPVPFDESLAKDVLSAEQVSIVAELDDGEAGATAWGCDLSYEYVRINGEYRT